MVQRFDIGTLRKPVRLDNGWMRVDGHLTRVGVFEYLNNDGTIRREYRPAEEVFKADSLESFALVPLTNDHPPEALNATNTKAFAVGNVGESIRRDTDHVRATLIITDAAAAKAAESGKTALSCGYSCDLDETPGTINGERYDAIQRNIRGNHVALVDSARAGPTAKIRMDATGAAMIHPPDHKPAPAPQEQHMSLIKMRLDGLDVEVTETAKQIIERTFAESAKRTDALAVDLATARADASKQSARADGLDAELKKATARADAAESPAKVAAAVKARVALETVAAKVLGHEFKSDGTDAELKIAIVEKLDGAKLDGAKSQNAIYLDARFDGAVSRLDGGGIADANRKLNTPPAPGERDDGADPVEKARLAFEAGVRNAWKPKVVA